MDEFERFEIIGFECIWERMVWVYIENKLVVENMPIEFFNC